VSVNLTKQTLRSAPLKSARFKFEPSRSAPCRLARLRSTPCRETSRRVCSLRLALSIGAFLSSRIGLGVVINPSSDTKVISSLLNDGPVPVNIAIVHAWATLRACSNSGPEDESLSISLAISSKYFCNASCCARYASVSCWLASSCRLLRQFTKKPTIPTIPVINPPPSNATMIGPRLSMSCYLSLSYSQKYGASERPARDKLGCKIPTLLYLEKFSEASSVASRNGS
jgi:hypothetical protein